jgi:Uma2 family endonuclease
MEGGGMAMATAPGLRKLDWDDFVLFPDDGKRHELIDGVHYVTASPNLRHQTISMNLIHLLGTFVRQQRTGKLFHAPFDVVLSRHDIVEPDLLYVSAARAGDVLTAANVQGPPDLAVEILSPGTRRRDELLKRDLFERAGVSEYWLVDPEAETVKVFRRDAQGYGRAELLSQRDGDVLRTPLLPGLELPLAEIFAE